MASNVLTWINKRSLRLLLVLIFSSVCLIQSSCVTTASYDQYVYKESTSLKVDALKLMDKAEKPYGTQEKEIEKLTDQLDKLYEYEVHRKKISYGFRCGTYSEIRRKTCWAAFYPAGKKKAS